ncbi:MAG TPA: sorbosone dehydrogenase family protein [Bradyrhizobium sp.]|uniref:PQQ-dependent sugar dehydrogenase n=1 Tax=Bradyrhizobium sp. TaxID=376 RepID=UPI002D80532B|nr:sorbosone dehydrogenase family protein [Bradyrhizobium sp.]HET7888215.1 sorbosone dehydrogenase family protein [Bradyrhizobium sp.]
MSVTVTASAETRRLTGSAAFGDWRADRPGVVRLIRPDDLPKPGATASSANVSRVVARPAAAAPLVPSGFKAELLADGLSGPREMRTAPNGDIFVSETRAGRVRVLRLSDDGSKIARNEIFASGLSQPFGIAFFPSDKPQWVYVANTGSVVRFPYRDGDLKAEGKPETVVSELPRGGHSTRDIVFTADGKRMLVSVGSGSNDAEGIKSAPSENSETALGASSGYETRRADVLSFNPEGKDARIFATGIRNCVGLAVHPTTGDAYCSTNERDGFGDNLVPDYVTRIREGAFYGWPWFYIGNHEDPHHAGERPDLKDKVTVPDVLIQPHSASLGLAFYDGQAFPAEYRGDGFAAEHGSWNRAKRTGYKVIRIRMKDGVPTGEYEDFMTGFVINDSEVWGRPVGVAVTRDGALLVSEDGNGTIWRISH